MELNGKETISDKKINTKILIVGDEINFLSGQIRTDLNVVKIEALKNIISEMDVAIFLSEFSIENLRSFKIFKQGKSILAIYVCKLESGFAIFSVLDSSTQPEDFFDENFNEENLEDYINGYLKFWNLEINSNEFDSTENQLMEVGKICSEIVNAYSEGKPFKIFPDFYLV